ncbi:uncharacterized protein [Anoplolepis gracilipes]|uniref:uncharacterized protein n=1 Tax=Anoplolepis gracilipes TaxID=354296 RepID=UPI003B9F4F35
MAKSIRSLLSPLLIMSYACGLRIVEFPTGQPRLWFSYLYILLLWSTYCFLVTDKPLSYIPDYSAEYKLYVLLNIFIALLSMLLGVYHDKKFRNCLKKIASVDNTLEKFETTMNQKLNKKLILMVVLGWSAIALLLNYTDYIRWQDTAYNPLKSIYVTFMLCHCSHINIINDLIFASILGYIGLKFDEMNKYLYKLTTENIRGTEQASESSELQQCNFSNVPNNKYMIWIVIHLHLELHKISREVNSIFEIEMTFKMVCYFAFIAEFIRELFTAIFVRNYSTSKRILMITIIIFWLVWYISRLLLINYICERVSAKANATGGMISKISYFTCDSELRKNILQFLLQRMQAPLKFHGLRLFQFGYKFLYGYFESILTLAIILVQTDKFKGKY